MAKAMKSAKRAKTIDAVPKAKATPAADTPKSVAISKAKAKPIVKAPPKAKGAAGSTSSSSATAAPVVEEVQVPAKAEYSKLVGFLKYHCKSKDQSFRTDAQKMLDVILLDRLSGDMGGWWGCWCCCAYVIACVCVCV